MTSLPCCSLFRNSTTPPSSFLPPSSPLPNRCLVSYCSSVDVIPVVPVSQGYIAELFHGPTQSFKDFGQQLLVAMVDYFAAKRGRRHTLVVATTGDTGPAAISAVARSKALSIVCGYPKGQISRLQELQMTTVDHPNVKVCMRVSILRIW